MHDQATYMKFRHQFIDVRREQRDAIARAMSSRLDPSGQPIFRVVESSNPDIPAGQGSATYTRWSQIDPPTDLRYWQWIKAFGYGCLVYVNLQTLERDPFTLNQHVLLDAVSIEVFPLGKLKLYGKGPDAEWKLKRDFYGADHDDDESYFHSILTKFRLPLTDHDIDLLIDESIEKCQFAAHNGLQKEREVR